MMATIQQKIVPKRNIGKRRLKLEVSNPMLGVCTTCTATFGSGARIGMVIILPNPCPIQGPDKGEYRVLRGGSWRGYAWYLRSAIRFRYFPGNRGFIIGFRVARDF
jgi:formylglycine-generating enzyme required for sulfatase activity